MKHITLDGVIQGPGVPGEDTSGNFKYGGWSAPYGDEISGNFFSKSIETCKRAGEVTKGNA